MPSRLILARYFAREILQTTLAVTLILLLIFLSGRFARYLTDAATGKISADIILTLLLYRVPNILERVLPLGLFLGILLVFGRMYVENEDVFYYLTVCNENYAQPAIPADEGAREGILKGIHRVSVSENGPAKVQLWGSASMLNEALRSQKIL